MSLLWTGVLALGVVAFGWLYWKFPREVFLSAVFFMPFFFVFERWGLHLSTTEIFFSVLILVWLIKSWLKRKEFSLDLPVLLPVLLVVGVSFAAVLVAPYIHPALRETIQLVWIFALFYFFANQLAKGEVAVKEVAVLLVTASALLVFYGFFQYIFCTGPLYYHIAPNRMRAYASFGQPNPYAAYLLIVIFLALGLLSNPRGKRRNRIWLALGLLLAGLVTTFSQAGYVGLIGGLATFLLLKKRAGFRAATITTLLLAALIGASILDLRIISPRRAPHREDKGYFVRDLARKRNLLETSALPFGQSYARIYSHKQRIIFAKSALRMWKAHPILGVGPGNYAPLFPEYTTEPVEKNPEIVHSAPLQVAAETGTVGLIAFATLAGAFFSVGLALYRHLKEGPLKDLSVGLLSAYVAVVVNSLFGWPLTFGVQEPFVLTIAMLVAIGKITREKQGPEIPEGLTPKST